MVTTTRTLLRVLVALVGGYTFTWGFAVLGTSGLVALGLAYDDARMATMLLAFLVYLAVFLWSFAARRLIPVFAVLAGGGALMTGAAWALQQTMLG